MARPQKRKTPSLVAAHLGGIKRALLEGDKRPAFLAFLDSHLPARHGIYALYDKKGRLYYSGKASDLPARLNQHLKDRHGDSWDRMTLFMVSKQANVAQLEGLVIAAARPPGNKQKPKIGQDLRRSLRQYLKKDAALQIDAVVYPDKQVPADALAKRITTKKLREVSQARLAGVLGISQPRVSRLFKDNAIRKYIREAGKRDAVLLLLQKASG
jgi:AraC-like DNA-binding protein